MVFDLECQQKLAEQYFQTAEKKVEKSYLHKALGWLIQSNSLTKK